MSFLSRLLFRSSSTTTTKKFKISDVYKETDLKQLVEKFKKFSDFHQFRTDASVYKSTVRRLASDKRYDWIEEILEHQKQYKNISNEGFSARLITLYGDAGMSDNAQKVFDEMPERKCKQTVLSFNALLGACVNSKKYDKVVDLFKTMPKKLGIEPDLVSYNIVMKAFCETGSLDLASLLLDEMEKQGMNPDLITFNTLLSGFYLKGRFSDGDKIWDRMVNGNINPDVWSYNAKLEGLSREKKSKEAVELVEEMRSKTITPDVFSFNCLIKGFVDEGKLEEAKWWYDDMEKSRCAISKFTFRLLVPFVCEKGDLEFAFKLCKKVFKLRRLVDRELLQLVVDGLVKELRIDDAKEMLKLGNTNDYCCYDLKLPSDE